MGGNYIPGYEPMKKHRGYYLPLNRFRSPASAASSAFETLSWR